MGQCTHPMVLRNRIRLPSGDWGTFCDACGKRVGGNSMGIKPQIQNAPLTPSPQPKGGYDSIMPAEKSHIERMKIVEGNLMDVTARIKYNDQRGHWEVLWHGKVITKAFKTSGEAFQYLADLKSGKEKA